MCFVFDGGNHFAEMCSRRTRKVHTVAASVAPLDNCPQDARNDERVDTKLLVGELEISTVKGLAQQCRRRWRTCRIQVRNWC